MCSICRYLHVDYAPPREEEFDPTESDESMGAYIEQLRSEFYEEWFPYLDEVC